MAMAFALMATAASPDVSAFPFDPLEDSRLSVLASFQDPDSAGVDLTFRVSPDGGRLLMRGFGGPGEVRVTDLDTGNATVLAPLAPGFSSRGCDWSMTGEKVVVWGETGDEPRVLVYDAPDFQLNLTVGWLDLIDLAEVTEITYLAYDVIVSVAGRDASGTSRLMFIEVEQHSVRWNHVWEGNGTIIALEDNDGKIVILDDTETVTMLHGSDWNDFSRYPGTLQGGLSAWSVPRGSGVILGDRSGRVLVDWFDEETPFREVTVSERPVLGVAWTPFRYSNFLVATGLPGGGSRLSAWQIWSEYHSQIGTLEVCSMEIDQEVTMIAMDPRGQDRVMVATDDGTLLAVRYVNRPIPTEIRLGEPDQVDGGGLEPFLLWNPGGRSEEQRFYFNHRGSLIALRGFGDARDLRVVDRRFETVAQLSVPWPTSGFRGLEWSHGDRWLVTWGFVGGANHSRFAIRAFDAPDFKASETFPVDYVMAVTSDIHSMEFLPGDTVLAMNCLDNEAIPRLMYLDLGTGEVVSNVKLPVDRTMWDMRRDGDQLVSMCDVAGVWAVTPPSGRFERENAGPGFFIAAWDVNTTGGWAFMGSESNISVWNGTPREPAFTWEVFPYNPMGITWSNGHEGDLVIGCLRPASGTSLQLWRRGGPPPGAEWRFRDGYVMVSELNTSRDLVQLEADPAYPGMVAASFLDGTFALYYLNVTPYPPPPDDLEGLDTGPIYPLDDGSGGDGSDLPWGSSNDWVFPLALVAAIVLLGALLLLLRFREGRRES